MNKKLVPRIIGMVGGLIIAFSLFIPFVKDAGSLWNIFMNNGQMYLVFVIMIFGLLPTLLYGINKKTEYSYMSVGALLFFELLQLANTVSSNSIKSLDIGFYVMFVGILMVAIATFILNKDLKVKVLDEQIAPISNNISDPLERNGLEIPIDETNTVNENEGNKILQDVDSNDEIEMLGEEIPDYEPENGVNPVLAEFATEENLQPSTENVEVPSDTQTDVKQNETEVAAANEPKEVPVTQPEVVSTTPEVVSTAPEIVPTTPEETPKIIPASPDTTSQPEIAFDESGSAEIPDEQEPQFDIFGQPK